MQQKQSYIHMMYIVQAKTVRKHEAKVHIHLRAKNAKIHMEQQHAKRYTKGICTVYVRDQYGHKGIDDMNAAFQKGYHVNQISM